ncbi:hypothetical protein Trydic_g1381 [Trypoxylus dichotomus]
MIAADARFTRRRFTYRTSVSTISIVLLFDGPPMSAAPYTVRTIYAYYYDDKFTIRIGRRGWKNECAPVVSRYRSGDAEASLTAVGQNPRFVNSLSDFNFTLCIYSPREKQFLSGCAVFRPLC